MGHRVVGARQKCGRCRVRKYLPGILLVILLALIFHGCADKSGVGKVQKSTQKLIFIKTPKLKYRDLGFIKAHENGVSVEIYSAGVAIAKIEVDNKKACINEDCYSKERFVGEFLHRDYQIDIFENIVLGRNIDAKGALYFIRENEIYFDDELHGVKIVIKDVE